MRLLAISGVVVKDARYPHKPLRISLRGWQRRSTLPAGHGQRYHGSRVRTNDVALRVVDEAVRYDRALLEVALVTNWPLEDIDAIAEREATSRGMTRIQAAEMLTRQAMIGNLPEQPERMRP